MTDLAIDFGTERTKVAFLDRHSGTRELLRDSDTDRPFFPSVFYVPSEGNILFGAKAEAKVSTDPEGVIPILKLTLREEFYPHGRAVSARELLPSLFGTIVERFRKVEPDWCPNEVSLTIPARWMDSPDVTGLLRDSCASAGFAKATLVEEPVAAAVAWLSAKKGNAEAVIVLDAGGGTVDWACLRRENSGFVRVSECPADCDDNAGGHTVDESLLKLAKSRLQDRSLATELLSNKSRYLMSVRRIKEDYCTNGRLTPLAVTGADLHEDVCLSGDDMQHIFRSRFIGPVCSRFVPYVKKAQDILGLAEVPILLVGGSSNLRGLLEELKEATGTTPIGWDRAEYATALGAISKPQAVPTDGAASSRPAAPENTDESIAAIQARWGEFAKTLAQMAALETSYALLVLYAQAWAKIEEAQAKAQADERFGLILEAALSISAIDFSTMPSQAALAARNGLTQELDGLRKHGEALGGVLTQSAVRNTVTKVGDGIEVTLGRMLKSTAGINPETQRMQDISPELGNWLNTHGREWGGILGGGFAGGMIAGLLGPPGWLLGMLGGWLGGWLGGGRKRRMIAQLEESAGRILEHYSSAMLLFAQNYHSLVADVEAELNSLLQSTGEPVGHLAAVPGNAASLLDQSRKALLEHACDGTEPNDENPSASECIAFVDEVLAALLQTDAETNVTAEALSRCHQAVKKAVGGFSDAAFHVAPNIPNETLEAALSTYGYGIDPKEVLCLHDTTWFSAKDGFLITPELIAWHNAGEDYSRIPLSDIRTVDTQSGYEDSFFINGVPVAISTTDNKRARSVFVKVVNAARKPSATQEKTRPSKSRASTARSGSKSAPGPTAISSLISQAREYAQAGSIDTAKSLFVKAAELGSAEAMEEMANIWSLGLGCTKDPAAAERWRKKAEKARRERKAAHTSASGIDASQTKPQLLDSMTKAQLGDLAEAVGVSFPNSRITKSEMIDSLLSRRSLTKARLVEFLSE